MELHEPVLYQRSDKFREAFCSGFCWDTARKALLADFPYGFPTSAMGLMSKEAENPVLFERAEILDSVDQLFVSVKGHD